MMLRRFSFCFLLLTLFGATAWGQQHTINRLPGLEKFGFFSYADPSLQHQNYFETLSDEMRLTHPNEMVLEKIVAGKNGYFHYKYQQYHQGLPIIGNTYILHEKDGQVVYANGQYTPNANKNTRPAISPGRAVQIAKQKMKADKYATDAPQPVLCLIDPAYPKVSEALRLAYQVDLKSEIPFDKQRFYVDAEKGSIIAQFPLILLEGVPSTAETRYYGTVNFITDSVGPANYVLRDPTRGEGIFVYHANLDSFTNHSPHWDLANDDKDEVALDAHYCSTHFYDMMLEKFGWDGQDGEGKALKATVHNNGAGNVNAFWDGEYSNYGDGDCIYGPLTTLEVVGHEFTHGVVDYTSQLVYAGESGAINESMADIFGKTLEHYADPGNFSWVLSHSFLLDPAARPFRVMDDPNSVNMPAYYGGEFWFDFNGVHTNSAIGNLWFSMLVDGKQGTNEAGYQFNIPALGMDKASQIAFHTNKNYLTSNSDYHDFYAASLLAAEELFGPNAAEIAAVAEAWKAVGLPKTFNEPVYDLSIKPNKIIVEEICGLNQYIPISVEVKNIGNQPFFPAAINGATLFFTSDSLAYSLDINDTIMPGEMATYTVPNWLYVESFNFTYVTIQLSIDDDSNSNNWASYYYQILEHSSSDIKLGGELSKKDCFSPYLTADFYLTNNSCEALPAGAVIVLSIENEIGSLLWSGDYILPHELTSLRTERISYDLDLPVAPLGALYFIAKYTGDPNPLNNDKKLYAPKHEVIVDDYLNEFNDELALEDGYLLVETYMNNPIEEYQGENYFGSTSLTMSPPAPPCPDYNNFNLSNAVLYVASNIKTCIDYSNYEYSKLGFDLWQFRNSESVANGYLFSNMLRVKWDGTESGETIISGLTETELHHIELPLPAYFKGSLQFDFYTEIGKGDIDESSFLEDDVILMDNLHMQTNATGTNDSDRPSALQLSPNPTNGLLTVRAANTFKSAQLTSLNGMVLQQYAPNNTAFEVDMGGLGKGLYFLRLEMQDGYWLVEKVVKME